MVKLIKLVMPYINLYMNSSCITPEEGKDSHQTSGAKECLLNFIRREHMLPLVESLL